MKYMLWLNNPSPREDVGDCAALACSNYKICYSLIFGCITKDNCHGNCGIYHKS